MTTVEEVAGRAGLTRKGRSSNWGPCPVCDADVSGSRDKRPPLRFKGGDQWFCVASSHGEPRGGGPVTLARVCHQRGLLSDDDMASLGIPVEAAEAVPTDARPVRPAAAAPAVADAHGDDDTADETIDVAGGWHALLGVASSWRARVEQWAVERGAPVEVARAMVASGGVAAIPLGQWPTDLGGWLRTVRWTPLELLVALRGPDGTVVDIERRWVRGQGAPPEGTPKTARLPAARCGQVPEEVMFGDLPAALDAAERGEPVVLVEGSSDWAWADAIIRISGRGAVLGSYGAHGLLVVARAIIKAAQRRDLVPGSWTIFVVPDVGDNLSRPHLREHRIGERCAWNASVDLLDVARVRWCRPARSGSVDLSDVLRAATDPVARFWTLLREGQTVLDSGHHVAGKPGRWFSYAKDTAITRWQVAKDWDLADAAYRLPLGEFIHYHHFFERVAEDGTSTIEYDATLKHRQTMDSATRITRAVIHWLRVHNVRFARDHEDVWLFDPLEPARAPLVALDEERELPRVLKVRSREHWDGWLQEFGYLNPTAGDGRIIERALHQLSQRAPRTALRSWLCSDGDTTGLTLRLHLGSRMEEVLRVDTAGARVVQNGDDGLILRREDDVPQIEWVAGMSSGEASTLLHRLVGHPLTVAPELRLMMVSHALLMPLREALTARPILFGTGPSGAGKSLFAKVWAAVITGVPDPEEVTTATAWEDARMVPMMLLDNLEARFLDADLEKFLLKAATRGRRRKRSLTSDRGVIQQSAKTIIHINAIGAPVMPEMMRRCLLVEHGPSWRTPGFSEMAHLHTVQRERSALWSAIMTIYQTRILGELARGAHQTMAGSVPSEHPNEGMREALGVMGVIGRCLAAECGDWGGLDWAAWLDRTASAIADTKLETDPLALALSELLLQWNRVVDAYEGPRRPALADALFACRPVVWDLHRGETSTDWTRGAKVGKDVYVVGFEGTYPELYRDLCAVTKLHPSFRDTIASSKDVGHNIGNCRDWKSTPSKRVRGTRRYCWVSVEAVAEVAGGDLMEGK